MNFDVDHLQKYRQLFSLILKYRDSEIFQELAATSALQNNILREEIEDEHNYIDPQELVEDMVRMGPTYIKLGQTLSTRPDLIPEPYLKALTELQDNVDPVPYEEVEKIIEEELGVKISKAFQDFDRTPLASASIGQVHKAILHSGRNVVVKVQRQGIRKQFISDLDILHEISQFAIKHSVTARKYHVDELLEELRHVLIRELDYTQEAENLIALHENLKSFEKIVVALPVLDYSTSKILTMDYIEGIKITSIPNISKTENDFSPLVDELLQSFLKQIIIDGLAHADPHPGNVHMTKDHRIALMDLGMVAKFGPRIQEQLLKLLISLSKFDGEGAANVLLAMSEYNKANADIAGFRKVVNRLLLDSKNKKSKDLQAGRLLIQINSVAADCGIAIAVELNILGKILLNLDQIVASLSPDFDMYEALKHHVERLMTDKMVKELKPENLMSQMIDTKRLFETLPERLNRITERLAENDFEIKVNAIDEKRLTDGFQQVANQISLGLISAALIIGSALLIRVPSSFTILGYPAIAMFFFITAAFFGLWLIIKIVRSKTIFDSTD